MSELSLNCCVSGDVADKVFGVVISSSKTVSDLKDLIKLKNRHRIEGVWKASFPDNPDFETKVKALIKEPPLKPTVELSKVFSASPTLGHVHVIVKLASDADRHAAKRPRLEENREDADMCEIHKLFWGVTDSRCFNTMKVKVPDPTTLEIDDEQEFTYIRLPDRVGFPFGRLSNIFITSVYEEFWKLLSNHDEEWQTNFFSSETFLSFSHATIVSGQLGIGKTIFLDYVLVRRLQEKKMTVCCTDNHFAHVFTHDGVEKVPLTAGSRIRELDNNIDCCALVNLGGGLPQPPEQFYPKIRRGRVVVATWPNKRHIRSFSHERPAYTHYMPTWNWDGLYCCSLLWSAKSGDPKSVGQDDAYKARVQKGYKIFGGIPRRSLSILDEIDGNVYISEIENAINNIVSFDHLMNAVRGAMPFTNNTSNVLVKVEPGEDPNIPDLSFVSNYVAVRVSDRLQQFGNLNVSDSIDRLLFYPQFGRIACKMFQKAVHGLFRAGIQFTPGPLTSGSPPLSVNILPETSGSEFYYTDLNIRAKPSSSDVRPAFLSHYFTPTSQSEESIDAIWVSNDVTVLFQITVATCHPIKLRGVTQLTSNLPANAKQRVCIVFVRPIQNKDKTPVFNTQPIQAPQCKNPAKLWEVEQYSQYVYYAPIG